MKLLKKNTVNKTTLTFLLVLFISIAVTAQQGINYKALIKDASGNVLNEFMNVEFTIHEATATGTIVYQEDENYTLVDGLLIHTIGTVVSPSVGTFAAIDWAANLHFLQTTITYSGGTINFDATQFMAVPYAKHATTAETAANIFSGDYNDLINQPTTLPTGLEKVTDSIDSGTGFPIYGWRLIGEDPENHGHIGEDAVDLSISRFSSSSKGATGKYSTAMGYETTALASGSTAMGSYTRASGYDSTAMGYNTTASGDYSTAMGFNTDATADYSTAMGNQTTASAGGSTAMGIFATASGGISTAMGSGTTASGPTSTAMGNGTTASGHTSTAMGFRTNASGDFTTAMGYYTTAPSYVETVIGRYNTDYNTPPDSIAWNVNDRLFVIGNGTNNNKSNALTVLKNGTTILNNISDIDPDLILGGTSSTNENGIIASDPQYSSSDIFIRSNDKVIVYLDNDNSEDSTFSIVNDSGNGVFEVQENGNLITGGPLSIQDATDNTSSWQFTTVSTGHLSMFRNGNYRGFFNESSGAYSSISDRRLKKDIISFENGTLNKVMQLNPVSYLMKDQTDTKRNLGLISQEVQKIFPNLTNYDKEANILTMSYTELIPVLIKATQEQQEIIETQNKNIENLIKRLEVLENKND